MREERQIRKLLPIGSVVLLKNGRKPVMICGVCQTDNETGNEYDYVSLAWPEGYLGSGSSFMFNQGDIDHLLYRGLDGPDRDLFIDSLVDYYAGQDGR